MAIAASIAEDHTAPEQPHEVVDRRQGEDEERVVECGRPGRWPRRAPSAARAGCPATRRRGSTRPRSRRARRSPRRSRARCWRPRRSRLAAAAAQPKTAAPKITATIAKPTKNRMMCAISGVQKTLVWWTLDVIEVLGAQPEQPSGNDEQHDDGRDDAEDDDPAPELAWRAERSWDGTAAEQRSARDRSQRHSWTERVYLRDGPPKASGSAALEQQPHVERVAAAANPA